MKYVVKKEFVDGTTTMKRGVVVDSPKWPKRNFEALLRNGLIEAYEAPPSPQPTQQRSAPLVEKGGRR